MIILAVLIEHCEVTRTDRQTRYGATAYTALAYCRVAKIQNYHMRVTSTITIINVMCEMFKKNLLTLR